MKKEEKKEAEKRAPGNPLQDLSAHCEDKKHKGANKSLDSPGGEDAFGLADRLDRQPSTSAGSGSALALPPGGKPAPGEPPVTPSPSPATLINDFTFMMTNMLQNLQAMSAAPGGAAQGSPTPLVGAYPNQA